MALREGVSSSVSGRPAGKIAFLLYRLSWTALFVAAVASVAFFNVRDEWRTQRFATAGFALGVSTYQNNAAEGLLLGPFNAEGERLGFRPSDLLLAVDGVAVPPNRLAATALLRGPANRVVSLRVKHSDGVVETIRVVRDPERQARAYAGSGINFTGRRWAAFAVQEIAGVASLIAALLLFLRNPRDKVAQLLSFSLVLLQASFAKLIPAAPNILEELQYALAAVLLTLAVLLFPRGRLENPWQWLALVSAMVGNGITLILYLRSVYPDWALLNQGIPPKLLLLAVMLQLRQTPPGIARQQTKSVLFGIAMFCVFTIANTILVQLQLVVTQPGAKAWIVLLSHLTYAFAGIAIPAGLLVSLLRFRLYDAETAISRSVAYGALTVMLLGIFGGSEKIIEVLGEQYLGEGLGALSSGLGAGIAAATMIPLHNRVTRWAERRFQGNLVRLRKGLPALVADLRETSAPPVVGEATLARVELGVRATRGAIVADAKVVAARGTEPGDVQRWLERFPEPDGGFDRLQTDRGDPLFPLRVPLHADGVGLTGWLLLGPRPDGSLYGKDEREALLEIADPIARALAIATQRDVSEGAREGALAGLRQRLAEIERLVEQLMKSNGLAGSPAA